MHAAVVVLVIAAPLACINGVALEDLNNARLLNDVDALPSTSHVSVGGLGEGVANTTAGSNVTYKQTRITESSEHSIDNNTALVTMSAVTMSFDETSNGTETCGDGVRVGREQCDDGNLNDGDGCSKLCTVEGGFACAPKQLGAGGDKCHVCPATACTIYHNKQYRCNELDPTKKPKKATKVAPTHVRAGSGFCMCAPNHCQDVDGAACRPVGHGWELDMTTGKCRCGLGYCLLPFAAQTIASSEKYHCFKMTKEYVRAANSSICKCSAGSPEVLSTDPAVAQRFTLPACKVYPSTPLKKIKHQGASYGAFSCHSAPYMNSTSTEYCTDCEPGACKMPRTVNWPTQTVGAPPKPFYCVANATVEAMGMTRNADGTCACKAADCLIPFRDTFKCAALDGSHPYGGVKLANGKCGCATDADACIMPLRPDISNKTAPAGFMCLRLKDGTEKTRFGTRYYRGKTGHCKCVSTRCRADPAPRSVGAFRCINMEKNGAYFVKPEELKAVMAGTSAKEDLPCECRPGSCLVPGITAPKCMTCPTIPGDCRSRCTATGPSFNTTTCVKYCSTQNVEVQPKPEIGYGDMFDKKNMQARVIRCFVSKTVTCTSQPATTAKNCTQTVTGRLVFDCPGRYSAHAARKLIDGEPTFGYKSVCTRQNLECQKDKCNTVGSAALCLKKMLLS